MLLLLTAVFQNCQPEDISEEHLETSDLTIGKNQQGFTIANYNDAWVKDNLVVDWEHPITIKKDDNILVEEYSINLNKVFSP